MNKDRNMFFYQNPGMPNINTAQYSGMTSSFGPGQDPGMMIGQDPAMMPGQNVGMMPGQSNVSQLDERLTRMERQIRKLDQRLSKLENPYGTVGNTDGITIQPSFNVM